MDEPRQLIWTDKEVEALRRLVQLGKLDNNSILTIFPYRTVQSIRDKLRRLRQGDPDEWTPPTERKVNWDALEIMEAQCEESRSSEIPTGDQNLRSSRPSGHPNEGL